MSQVVSRSFLAAAVVLLLAACGGSSSSSGDSTTTSGGGSLKVGLVTDIGGLNDRSFNHLAYVGLQRVQRRLRVDGRVLTSKANSDYVPHLSSLARQDYDLVVAVGS